MSGDDTIDVARLLAQCQLAAVEYHTSLDSTQVRAAALAATATRGPTLVVADRQTAGRGRGANRWWTGPGSLAFSLLFAPSDWGLAGGVNPARSLAAGVAVAAAVRPALYPHHVGLHWPNDVFVAHRKLAGILIDVLADGRHVLGVGLNVNNGFASAPAEVRARGTSMIDLTGRSHDRTGILVNVLNELAAVLTRSAADPAQLGIEFQELCLQTGEILEIVAGGRNIVGRCLGIAPDGALLIESEGEVRQLYSGVIQHKHQ
ncbi:MAG TPA: biotin--[acetyl-CoA-carboxylase] ligase [Pirellulales bacterium]|nr:biotin--[acetyl-CoA-carboxylase] ligase [Pirellulales bacterium]